MVIARHKFRLLSAIVLIIAAVIGLNTLDNREQKRTQNTEKKTADIDFFIVDAAFKSFGNDGLLAQSALATRVEHFKNLQKSDLIAADISTYNGGELSVNINSSTAIVENRSTQITFVNNVLATSYLENAGKTYLKTERLHYDQLENNMSTDRDIVFKDTFGNITTATGLFIDIDLRKMQLLSNIKGVFNEK